MVASKPLVKPLRPAYWIAVGGILLGRLIWYSNRTQLDAAGQVLVQSGGGDAGVGKWEAAGRRMTVAADWAGRVAGAEAEVGSWGFTLPMTTAA